MNKLILMAAGFAALLMTACGGEKTEEKKEEKKELSEETLTQLEELKNDWMAIDNGLIDLSNTVVHDFPGMSFNSNLDSLKLVIEKSPKAMKEMAMPLFDSISIDKSNSESIALKIEAERNDWDLAKDKFLELQTSIEKKEIGEDEAKERLNSSKALFDSFKESMESMNGEISKFVTRDSAFKAAITKK